MFVARRYRLMLALVLLAVVAGCRGEPEMELPPANLEARNQLLEEVRKQLAVLEDAGIDGGIERLHHSDHRVRRAAAQRLAELGPAAAAAVDPLIELLEDEHPRVVTAAAIALGGIGDKRALDPLIAAMMHEQRQVRLWAWKGARRLSAGDVSRLIYHMGRQSPLKDLEYKDEVGERRSIRMEIRDRLVVLGRDIVPGLIAGLSQDDQWIAINCARVLGNLGEDAADGVQPLITALKSQDKSMREVAAEALGKIGDLDPEVMPALRRAAKDKVGRVAKTAKTAIKNIERAAKQKRNEQKKKEAQQKKGKARPVGVGARPGAVPAPQAPSSKVVPGA